MLPILIICYLRPEKLESILSQLTGTSRKIYVFIDRAEGELANLNKRVLETANRFASNLDIRIQFSDKNVGVAKGVPVAIDWVFNFEKEIIVIEDDCLPTKYAYLFFDNQYKKLNDSILMVCATSPNNYNGQKHEDSFITLSNYPLIWGWATNKQSWFKLRNLLHTKTPHMRVLNSILKNPKRIISYSYFYAAVIRINRGEMLAWDSAIALEMLLSNYKAIIPDITMVENSGKDMNASHFSNPSNKLDQIIISASKLESICIFNGSENFTKITNKKIEKNIYNFRMRNIFSPLKALLGF